MPSPRRNESKPDFVRRCIPIVLDDGTAKNPAQAVAVCSSMWEQARRRNQAIKKLEVKLEDENQV